MPRILLYKFLFILARIYWRVFSPHSHSAVCLIEHNGKILLVRNTYGDMKWVFPGGGCKIGENPEKSAQREIAEEVGITVSEMWKFGDYSPTTLNKNAVVHCFYSRVQNSYFDIDINEIYEGGWFSWTELPQRLSLDTERIIEIYRSQ